MRRTLFLLFFVHLLTRLIFINVSGVDNNYTHQCDSYWLVKFADEVVIGNFNFDIGRFIASPMFPVICGIIKILSPHYWTFYMILFQLFLSAITGLFIYRIAMLLLNNKDVSMLASLLYAIFPATMWYVHTFSQETLFQSLLIITIYYLIKCIKSGKVKDTVLSAIFFSLTYLTKSHILLFCLFIPLIYFHCFRFQLKTISFTLLFAGIVILFSIPYGLYHYKKNSTYVLSSNGSGYQFYLGNTEAGYRSIVDVPEKNSEEFKRLQDITVTAGYFNHSGDEYESMLMNEQKVKQRYFFGEAINWIKANPVKFLKLKAYDSFYFLLPGVSFRHYDLRNWLLSFILSVPVYLLAYFSILKLLRKNFRLHSWILYLIVAMLIFSTFWYVQNRFRTITLEPFYIIYASVHLESFLRKFASGKSIMRFLKFMFLEYPQSILIGKQLKSMLRIS